MNIQPDTVSNISDDQELAKALAGVNGGFEETPIEEPAPEPEPAPAPAPINPLPIDPLALNPVPERDELEQVKIEAINELRPLVDKLVLPPEEKFDVYLLLIRCTDDRTLVAPAHEVAKLIEDDTRRAQALLDIIKEIDYLSSKPAPESDGDNESDIAEPAAPTITSSPTPTPVAPAVPPSPLATPQVAA